MFSETDVINAGHEVLLNEERLRNGQNWQGKDDSEGYNEEAIGEQEVNINW